MQVDPQGIQLSGNPTGGGESHLYIKPNFDLLGHQFGQAAPPQESNNNVQVSYGDGKTTATEQLKVAFLPPENQMWWVTPHPGIQISLHIGSPCLLTSMRSCDQPGHATVAERMP